MRWAHVILVGVCVLRGTAAHAEPGDNERANGVGTAGGELGGEGGDLGVEGGAARSLPQLDERFQPLPGGLPSSAGKPLPTPTASREAKHADPTSLAIRGGSTPLGPLLWLLLGIGVIVAVVALVGARGGRVALVPAATPEAASTTVISSATPAQLTAPLADAEALAAQGLYAAAIHTLLQKTLRELATAARVDLPRGLTSREIAGRTRLSGQAPAALRALVGEVERTHFNDEPASADDFARCRTAFAELVTAYRGNVPRVELRPEPQPWSLS